MLTSQCFMWLTKLTPLKDQFQLQMVDDDKKFAVSLDVSQFRPEELKVQLEGRQLTIEGKQEHKTENSAIQRSFIRKYVLPENVDLEAIRTQLDDKGHLSVEGVRTSGTERNEASLSSLVYWPLQSSYADLGAFGNSLKKTCLFFCNSNL
ncbi:unnamed protein product [Haemonchus placei]|uniref:SHSP domain-containing protein n=1 Tax=Haemonchus placei TaxID=6290 RepID=A0A0N4X9J1_HAEPC|nr:unnamed protein product [Haemonchus placei]